MRIALVIGLLVVTGACAPMSAPGVSSPEREPPGFPAPDPQRGAVLRIDPTRSRIAVDVYRDGVAARLGHDHVVVARPQGFVQLQASTGRATAALYLTPADFRVDEAGDRAASGRVFASTPDADAIEQTRRNMLGPAVLDAVRHPHVVLLVSNLTASDRAANGAITGIVNVEVAGRSARLPIAATFVRDRDGNVVVSGTQTVAQSALSLQPFTVLGGMLAVRDELDIHFSIVASANNP